MRGACLDGSVSGPAALAVMRRPCRQAGRADRQPDRHRQERHVIIQAKGAVTGGGWTHARLQAGASPRRPMPHTIVVEFRRHAAAAQAGGDSGPAAGQRPITVMPHAQGRGLGAGGFRRQRNHHPDPEIRRTVPPARDGSMQIDFISDTVCPWCFIGKRRLARAMAMRPNIAFDVRYRPYRLDPTVPQGGHGPRTPIWPPSSARTAGIEEAQRSSPPKAPRKASSSISPPSGARPTPWIPTA